MNLQAMCFKEKWQTEVIGSRKAFKAISDPNPACPCFACSVRLGEQPDDDDQHQQLSYGSPNHYSEIFWGYVTNEKADQVSRDHVSPQ